jgi:AcrR family transcriptional regulator
MRVPWQKKGGQPPLDLRDRIVDTAVELAEEVAWENLRLRKVADRLGVPLTTVLETFRDIDAVTDAWFARALTSMLRPPEAGFEALSARERAQAVLMCWFGLFCQVDRLCRQFEMAGQWRSVPRLSWGPSVMPRISRRASRGLRC